MDIKSIKERYDLETNNPDEIKIILKQKLKEFHPDNGKNVDGDYYTKLKEDYDFVEKLIKKQEVANPIEEMARVLTETMQQQIKNEITPIESLNKKLSESVNYQILENRVRRKNSRYSSAGILTIITFLWMFPNQVLEHPIIKELFRGEHIEQSYINFVTQLWIVSICYTVMCWIILYLKEQREKELFEEIKLENTQNEIFMCFRKKIIKKNSPGIQFSKKEFMEYIQFYLIERSRNVRSWKEKSLYMRLLYVGINKKYFNYTPFSVETIQNIADIILFRAKELGVVKSVKSYDLIECFEFAVDKKMSS